MNKKRGIIIAVILLLLLSVGTFAFTRTDNIDKLDGNGVIDKDGSNHDKDQDDAIEPSNDSTGEDDNTQTSQVLGQVGGNGHANQIQANPPVFTLDDVKVDRVEFASDFTMPEVQVQDEDGTMLTAVITYEYRATESDEFEAATSFDTTRIGQYRITYTVTNSRGLSSSQSFIVTISDTTDPVVGGVPSGATKEDVTLDVTEAGEYTVTVNGDEYDGDLTFTESGNYEVTVEDASGNSVTVKFTIDKDKPVVTLYKGENVVDPNVWYNGTLKAKIEDLTNYTATLNAVAYTSEEEITDTKWYTLVVTDEVGNETTVEFGVDTVKPNFKSGSPYHTTVEKDVNGTLSCPTTEEMMAYAIDEHSGVASMTFDEKRSNVDVTKVGDYKCYYTIYDNAGNSINKSIAYHVKDTIAPEITRIKLQTQYKDTNYANIDDKLMITVETNEDLLSNPELQINGITPKFSSVNKETFPKNAEQPTVYKYTFYDVQLNEDMKLEENKAIAVTVKVTDLAGNTPDDALTSTGFNKENKEKEVIYDNVKPTIWVGDTQESANIVDGVAYTNNATVNVRDSSEFTFVVKDADDQVILTQNYQYAPETHPAFSNPEYYFRGNIDYGDLLQQNSVYTIEATDKAGNTQEYKFVFDKTAPVVKIYQARRDTDKEIVQDEDEKYYFTAAMRAVITDDDEWTATFNGVAYTEDMDLTTSGNLVVIDRFGNEVMVSVVVDTVHPFVFLNGTQYVRDQSATTVYFNREAIEDSGVNGVQVLVTDDNLDKVTLTKNGDALTYSDNMVLSDEGTYSIEASDKTGGRTTKVTFVIDRTPLDDYRVGMTVWGANADVAPYVTTGSTAVVWVMYDERPVTEPSITIAGYAAERIYDQSTEVNGKWYYKYVGTLDLPLGLDLQNGDQIPFEVKAYDEAGNETKTTEITEGENLIYDIEGPDLIIDGVKYPTSGSNTITVVVTKKDAKGLYVDQSCDDKGLSGTNATCIVQRWDNKDHGISPQMYPNLSANQSTSTIYTKDKLGNKKQYTVTYVKGEELTGEELSKTIHNNSILTLPNSELSGDLEINAQNVTINGQENSKITGNLKITGDGATIKDLSVNGTGTIEINGDDAVLENVNVSTATRVALNIKGDNATITGGTYGINTSSYQGMGAISISDASKVNIQGVTTTGGIQIHNFKGTKDTLNISGNTIKYTYEDQKVAGIVVTMNEELFKTSGISAKDLYSPNNTFEGIPNSVDLDKEDQRNYYVVIQDENQIEDDHWKRLDYVMVGTIDGEDPIYPETKIAGEIDSIKEIMSIAGLSEDTIDDEAVLDETVVDEVEPIVTEEATTEVSETEASLIETVIDNIYLSIAGIH